MTTLSDAIRREIERSGQTRYRIAKESGIAQSQLSRFVRGTRGLDVGTIERLAEYLKLKITVEREGEEKKGR